MDNPGSLWNDLGSRASLHTGTVDQELLLRNEYLAAENRILRAQVQRQVVVIRHRKSYVGGIAHRLKRKALENWRRSRNRIRC